MVTRSEAMLTVIKNQFDMHRIILEGDHPCILARINRKTGRMKECTREKQDHTMAQRSEKIAQRFNYGPYEYTSNVGYFQAAFGLAEVVVNEETPEY